MLLDDNTIVGELAMPCDGCKLADKCTAEELECFAFRRWSGTGQYTEKQIGRHLRHGSEG